MAKPVVHTNPYQVFAQRKKDGSLAYGPTIVEAVSQAEASMIVALEIGSIDKLRKVEITANPLA